MGTIYEDYILGIKGLKEAVNRRDSSALNVSLEIQFKNDPWQTYDRLVELGEVYPFEGAAVSIYEVYRDKDGIFFTDESEARDRLRAEIFQLIEIQMPVSGPLLKFTTVQIDLPAGAAKPLIFKGVLDQPRETDLMEFRCSCSSLEYHYNRLFEQTLISLDDYPSALEDVGKVIPIIYGANIMVPALRVIWGVRSVLNADIDEDDTSLVLADASNFPTSGAVIINTEEIVYTGKSGNTLTGLTRGYGSTDAALHGKGSIVLQKVTAYRSVLADHALESVDSVWAELPDGRLVLVDAADWNSFLNLGRQIIEVDADAEFEVDEEVNVKAANVDAGTEKDSKPYPDMPEFIAMASSTTVTTSDTTPAPSAPAGKLTNIHSEINWVARNDSDGTYNYYVFGQLVATLGPFEPPLSGTIIKTHTSYPSSASFEIVRINQPAIFTSVSMELQSGFIFSSRLSSTKIGSQSRVVRYHAIVDGYESTSTDYGPVGGVIQNPSYIIKHFLVERLGFSLSDIDGASFSSAASSYGAAISGGYKMGFSMDKEIKFASRAARDMAHEARSVLYFSNAKWELDFLPDTAPAADHTVDQGELAGQGSMFKFSSPSAARIINYYEANYARNYSRLNDESEWDGNITESNSSSITKYGERRKKLDFKYVRLEDMVSDVLDLYLKQTSSPLREIDFQLYFDRFDIEIGDTIQIDSDLYDGEKYFIETVDRQEKETARFKGRRWW